MVAGRGMSGHQGVGLGPEGLNDQLLYMAVSVGQLP